MTITLYSRACSPMTVDVWIGRMPYRFFSHEKRSRLMYRGTFRTRLESTSTCYACSSHCIIAPNNGYGSEIKPTESPKENWTMTTVMRRSIIFYRMLLLSMLHVQDGGVTSTTTTTSITIHMASCLRQGQGPNNPGTRPRLKTLNTAWRAMAL